jgi:predicted neuraminidase
LPYTPARHRGVLVQRRRAQLGADAGDLAAEPGSGIDAVALHDGRALLAYNPSQAARTPLCLAVSGDGLSWRNVRVLEDGSGEYSYPAIIQDRNGSVHVTYTWNRRRIRYVRLCPDEI